MMSVAAFMAHHDDPFSAKELALAYWTIAAALILTGPGDFSLDRFISKKKRRK
jgi:putative oxidoreductase